MRKPAQNHKGFTYVEILISAGVVSILIATIYSVITLSYQMLTFTSSRVSAIYVAQEKIESIRNLPYDFIGTQGGIPNGSLLQNETAFRNGQTYNVSTYITYIDDNADGIAPTDSDPMDYKRIRISVSWEMLGKSNSTPVIIVNDISPRTAEENVSKGTIKITVNDAYSLPVPNANVSITATSLSPQVNIQTQTDINGEITLPGATTCTNCYRVSATKLGYSLDRTYSFTEVANPVKPDLSVISGQLSLVTFNIDKTSTIKISTVSSVDNNFQPLPNIAFSMYGEKIIGIDTQDNPVLKYDQDFTTNSNGEIEIENLEWDNYNFRFPVGYDLSASYPIFPIRLLPDSMATSSASLSTATTNNLYLIFYDNTNNLISSTSATLTDALGSVTKISGFNNNVDQGQVFFPNLVNQNYTLSASASGYLNHNETINISGKMKEIIYLTK